MKETRGGAKYHFLSMEVGETKLIKNKSISAINKSIHSRREYHERMDIKFKCKTIGNDVLVERIA